MNSIQDLKQQITIQQVLNLFNIEQKGRQYRCPFHSDKNPSASVKNEKFHCFACGWHGDIIDFANGMGMSTKELANAFGIEWGTPPTPEQKQEFAKRKQEQEFKKQQEKLLQYQIYRLCDCRGALWSVLQDDEHFAIKHLDGLIGRMEEHKKPLDHDVEARVRALWNRYKPS